MSEIILSAFADEYATSFDGQLIGMADFGIGFIELRQIDGKNVSKLTLSEAKEVKRKLDAFGIRASAIGSPLGKIALDGDMKKHLEDAERVFEIAALTEARFVRVFSFYAPEGENIHDRFDDVTKALSDMTALARGYGVTLCHENEAKIYGDTPERCRELLDALDGELKCVFDMGNFVLENVRPYPDAYELLKRYIEYFHIKDALFEGAVVPPGKGNASIGEILAVHRKYASEDFFVSLEPHLQTFSGLNALVGRSFDNPYKYADQESAFADAVKKFKELI